MGSLSQEQVAQYGETGQVGPVEILTMGEVEYFRGKLEAAETALGGPLSRIPGQLRAKTHLLYTWMDELVRHSGMLDAVESLIGHNILIYHLTCWIKEPGDGSFVTWHQDGTYFNLSPAEHVTAWIALSDATRQSGCMRMLPCSHRIGQQEHGKGPTDGNLLSNGQKIVMDIDESKAIDVVVPAGYVSFHHTHVIHSSGPNLSQDRRIGIGVSYVPTRVQFLGKERVSAGLVRGHDEFGHFDLERRPIADLDDDAIAFHTEACRAFFGSHGSQRAKGVQ